MVSQFFLHRLNPLAEAADMITDFYRGSQFIATVVSTDGNKVNIQRIGSSVTEGPFAARAGLAAGLSPGDVVKVARVGRGAFIVEYEVAN